MCCFWRLQFPQWRAWRVGMATCPRLVERRVACWWLSYHVKDVLGTCSLRNVCFGSWMTITTSGTGADEEWSREVMPKDACATYCQLRLHIIQMEHCSPQGVRNIGDVNHCSWP